MDAATGDSADLRAPVPRIARKWWLAEWSSSRVRAFRIALCLVVAVHFGRHLIETAPFLASSARSFSGALAPLGTLTALKLRGVFAVAVGLALVASTGRATRLCAVLLHVAGVATFRALVPGVSVDDYLANVATLALFLLPLETLPGGKAASVVPGASLTVFLALVSLVYSSCGLGVLYPADIAYPRFLGAALVAIPVLYVLPNPVFHVGAVALQVLIHGYLITVTPLITAHLLLLSTVLLFWGEAPPVSPDGDRPWVVDGGAVCGGLLSLLGLLATIPGLVGSAPASAASKVLFDLGVAPIRLLPPERPGARLAVRVAGMASSDLLYPDSFRASLMASSLAGERAFDAQKALARAYCDERGYLGMAASLVLLRDGTERALADFECGEGGSLASIR